ncbi:MAG: response regulator [Magnetococcales bacterium]|nr:response regulator [Magnetococcales bacterium]
MALKENEEFLSAPKAANLLGVALPTVHEWVKKGALRAWKTEGGHRRILKSSIDAMLRQREESLARPAAKKRLAMLVVEDDPIMTRLYQTMVAGWDFPVALETCPNGFEALLQVGREQPDIIITDLAMPDMDGFRMVRILRERPDLAAIRIIAVTALDDQEIERRGGLPPDVPLFRKPPPLDALEAMARSAAAFLNVPVS